MKGIYTQLEVKSPKKNAFYGFMSKTHFLLSTTYSLMNSRNWFDKLVLYTDKNSWEHMSVLEELIDEVIFIPNDAVPRECYATWSAGKIWVLSQQNEPYVHLDNDAYVLTPKIIIEAKSKPIICHIKEPSLLHKDGYVRQFKIIEKYGTEELPGFEHDFNHHITSYATGVVGGQSWDILQEIFGNVMNFLHNKKPVEDLATALEQGYFAMFCRGNNIDVEPMLLENMNYDKCWREMRRTGYIHLVSEHKKGLLLGEDLVKKYAEEKVLMAYPHIYKKIINLGLED